MPKNKWLTQLQDIEGAIVEETDPFEHVLQTVTPSVNAIFGRSWGLPMSYTAVVYGPPKEGKTVFTHLLCGHLHMTDPEALVVKFDSEYRSKGQLTRSSAAMFGIDMDRIQAIENNKPTVIFDSTEKKIAALCEKGAPIKLVIVDSLYGIQGRRESEAESVEQQIIGDHAATLQVGLKRLLAVQRKYGFAVVLVDQVRSEMDRVEQMRGNKYKMRSAFAVMHHAEYFINCEKNRNKAGKTDAAGNEFVDESTKDMTGKGDTTAAKFRVKMKESSMGPAGRTGEYTFDFRRGVVNVHEEVFMMAKNRGVIKRPNNVMYEYGGETWRGETAMLDALATSPELQRRMVADLMALDNAGIAAPEDTFDTEEP